jgi:hypothetical protein
MRSGCQDFRTGETINTQTFFDNNIDIHHIFPRRWCRSKGIEQYKYDSIINKTAISARTNRIIGGQAPSSYLKKLEEESNLNRAEMTEILATHGIVANQLYADDFGHFFEQRATALVELIENAMGKQVARAGADFLAATTEDEYIDDIEEFDPDLDEEEQVDNDNDHPTEEITASPKTKLAELEQQFDQAMIDIYEAAKRDINYTPTYFLQMVSEVGGVEAARRLLQKPDLSDGFTTLWVNQRLDLTVEAHVIKPEFRNLFTPQEIAIAEKRLKEVDYKFD